MNTTIRNTALASILFAAASSAAFAAETADLTVKGVIKPAACTPTLSGGAIVDFGTIAASSLSATAATVLPSKTVQLTITCDAATKMAVIGTDNRDGTENATASNALPVNPGAGVSYGVGAVNGKNIGAYALRMGPLAGTQANADGNAVDVIVSNDAGATWLTSTHGPFAYASRAVSWAPTGTLVPGAYKTVVQPISVDLAIGKIDELPALTQEVPIDGSATIAIKYL